MNKAIISIENHTEKWFQNVYKEYLMFNCKKS